MQHKWVCMVQVPMSEDNAAEALRTGVVNRDVTLKDVETMDMGCYNCEVPLTLESFKAQCPGEIV